MVHYGPYKFFLPNSTFPRLELSEDDYTETPILLDYQQAAWCASCKEWSWIESGNFVESWLKYLPVLWS